MKLNSIRWRLPISYAAITLLAALSLGSMMLLVLKGYYTQRERDYMLENAFSIQPTVEQLLTMNSSSETLQNTLEGLAFFSQTRIRVLNTLGVVLADTDEPDPTEIISIADPSQDEVWFSLGVIGDFGVESTGIATCDPEIGGCSEEVSPIVAGAAVPVDDSMTTMAVPFEFDTYYRSHQVVNLLLNNSLGTIEISRGPAYGLVIIQAVSIACAGAGIIAVLLATLAGWFTSRRFTRPVLALNDATQKMESGDLSARVNMLEKNPVTEFQTLAHSFNCMAQQVEDTVSTLQAFVADAAHELHTPLTALHTNLELAADETDSSRRTLFLERAKEQSLRLEGLVSGLLNLSRLEASQLKSEAGPLDLGVLLGEMNEQLASRTEQAGRNFSLILPEARVIVKGNFHHLQQVITNLFENSLKFTPVGGSIKISLFCEERDAVLTITDTGIGIPPEDLPNLFERFHRGRNAASFPGSGLGLAIVKALLNINGGTIAVESQFQQGTKMIVRLPLLPQ